MGKIYLTSDWHVGEQQTPNTHSFLRPRPTEEMIPIWLEQCNRILTEDDTLIYLGDLAITLDDIDVYLQLPKCKKILILGDKEYANKNFTEEQFMSKIAELNIFDEIFKEHNMNINGKDYFLTHKPLDCLLIDKPALCGHIHGCWRSAKMPNGNPILNVGIDAWGGLVSEEFVEHQYNAITKFYDDNAFPSKW